ncbi:MAG TPA: hypothetical protein VFS21_12645 [Roseiflexaceae bacterium]|nr:hypothetical protein [Roseiflexaceae bacterium]
MTAGSARAMMWRTGGALAHTLAALGVAGLLAACAPAPAAPAATPVPTALAPTAGATAAPTATATPALPAPTITPTPVPGGLFVDPQTSLGPISRLSFGSNYGPWSLIPPGSQKQLLGSKLTYVRFPGGNWGDEHDLTGQQIDDFITLCRQLQAEPGISVRLRNGNPAQAAALLRYTNIDKGYGVRYWSIGNEPTLYGEYDIERFNREWRATALEMRAIDPQIVLIGPDIHQFDADGRMRDPKNRFSMHEFMRAFLQANGDLVDIVSIHRYPFPVQPKDGDPTVAQLRANSREWDALIPALRTIIRETTGRDLPVAVTEVNANWTGSLGGDATPDSTFAAVWWADSLGRMIRQRVEIVAHFAIFAPQSEGWGLLNSFSTRPAYHVYQLYSMFGQEQVYASSDDPNVTIVAARRSDGALTLMITNLADQPAEPRLMLAGGALPDSAETWRLDAEHRGTQVDPTPLDGAGTLTLPAQSVTLLVLPSS